MTISTIHSERPRDSRTRDRRAAPGGFTLVEVIIGATLSAFILAGVLSAFLMLGRSGANAANYSMSETQIRRAIEEFAQDVRMANNLTWNSERSITLTVPGNYAANGHQVTYAWDNATTGDTAQCFYRMPGDSSSTAAKTIFVRQVSALSFARFNRLQLTMNVRRTGKTLVAANTTLVSASYTLRNKVAN
jgi:Tfp pilus assembly protein PilW